MFVAIYKQIYSKIWSLCDKLVSGAGSNPSWVFPPPIFQIILT